MKKLSLICLLFVTFFLLSNPLLANKRNQIIKGNGNLITKSMPISNFSKISVGVNVEINYSQAPNIGILEFTIDNNLLEYYDIYTEEDVLYIKRKVRDGKDRHRENSVILNPTKNLITVSSEQLEGITITGSSKVNFCTDFTSNTLEISLTGSSRILANKHPVNIENCKISITGTASVQLTGKIHLADVIITGSGRVMFEGAIQQANMVITGSGSAQLKGNIQQASMSIAGRGSVKALDCTIAQLEATIAGSGVIEAQVTDKLDANIAGRGKIRFKGTPDIINYSVAGSGKITKI